MFHLPAFIIIQIYAIIKIYISNKKFSFNSHNKPSEKFVEIPLDFSGCAVLSHGASSECQNPAPAFCRNYSWHSAQTLYASVSRAPPDNALPLPPPRLKMPHQTKKHTDKPCAFSDRYAISRVLRCWQDCRRSTLHCGLHRWGTGSCTGRSWCTSPDRWRQHCC